ncbi:hypothetical protein ANN_14977 [Periplaneta americana]|uniref:VWFA domain-containing protein n=1 Tax=Periplaneta americana TaxID=6978 RepID=A0ABQ8SZ70_PERAM|nr:hypothetical protein ANN_14977 [Periplaneta americana]
MIRGELQSESREKILELLGQMVKTWRMQEDERKQKEIEQESLFVTKCKTLSDEEQDAVELAEMFPTSITGDFGDLQETSSLDQAPTAVEGKKTTVVGIVSEQDMDFICQLHSHMMQSYTYSAWLYPAFTCRKYAHLVPDFIKPLLQRYATFSLLMEKLSRSLDSSLDTSLYPSLTLLTSVTLNYTDKGSTKFSDAGVLPLPPSPSRQSKLSTSPPSVVKSFDFYRDGFVTEVKQCFPFLESLTVRVKELLAEWPDHPTLKQILVVIERILNFSLTSPISRFLTGLELLLDKMHEWEENAHAGVSLASHWKNVTGQIGSWRKLELQCWKDCLDNAENRAKAAASKWWFYIYSLVESFTSTDKKEDSAEVPSTQELIKSLQKFMEQSTLGEFEARLNIVFTFHCHIVHLQKMVHKNELMSIFWNIYGYYSQFSETVAAKIRELRTPIEKKLKDCVKIFRWDDISHWAIKEAIHKVHKTLHKHIKQFQDILNQPVVSALTNPTSDENVGIWDRPQRHQHHRTYQCLLDPLNFISNSKLKKLTMESNGDKNEGSLLRRSGSLFMKARKLCQEIILNTSYAKHVQSVDGLITEIIEVSNHLKNLEVSSDLPKAKQKSQAKNFLQQKRKALADLFRTLQQMGVSYRTGLTYWNPDEESLSEFTIPPIDLRAAFQHLKNWRVDGLLLSVWEGCETYFLRSIARLALLNTSLQNPSKDLGPPAIERCRGFAMHLMVLSREQKLLLCESSHLLCSLRCHVAQLSAMEETDILLPRQSELQCWMIKLKELLVTCVSCLEQFRIFLYCCPDASCMSSSSVEPPVIEIEGLKSPEILQATKGNITWNSAVDRVKSLICSANKLKLTIERTEIVAPEMFHKRNKGKNTNKKPRMLVARAQFEALVDGYKQIEEFVKEIEDLKKIFDFSETLQQNADTETEKENKAREDINPMIASLLWLQKHIHDEAEKFSMFVENSNLKYFAFSSDESEVLASKDDFGQLENVKNFQDDVEAFLKNMLVVMQDVYKKYTQKNDGDIALKDDEIESAKEKDGSDQSKVERKDDDPGKEDESEIEDGHLKVKIIESLSSTVSMFLMNKTNEKLRVLMKKLVAILDTDDIQKGNVCKRLLLHCLPCLDQLVHLYQFFVTQQVASYRVSCKLLSVLLSIFLDLAQKGFCIPPEFAEKEGLEGDTTSGGMGLGEGEGEKDISEKIESEEQLEDARPKGEEKAEENEDCKEEEKGIEMTEDFDGKVQDLEKKEDAENDSDEDNDDDDDEDLDKEMGETEPGADKLDQQIWGSDSEDEGDENEGEDKEEERGTGEKIGEPELSAKEDNNKPQEETEEENGDERKEQEPNRKEINEMDDADENSEQIDPYHGKHEPLPEPEPLDLPDDLQLDDGDEKQKGEEGEEENPFDIDKMKEQNVPQEEDKNMEEKSEEKEAAEEDQMDLGDEETEEINKEQDETEKSESADTGGGNKDEEKGGDEPKTEPEKEVDKETAKPSEDRPSDNPVEGATEMDQTYGSKDQVIPDKKEDSTQALDPSEDTSAEGKDDKEGVGQAQTEETDTGHTGEMVTRKDDVQTGRSQKEQNIERRRLQESDSNRSLGEVSEPVKKKLRTMNIAKDDMETQEEQEEEEDGVLEKESADMYQHIKESKKKFDAQALDAATKAMVKQEQAEKQPVPNEEDTTGDEPKEDDDIEMQDNEDVEEENEIPTQKADKVASEKKRKERNEKRSGEKVDEGGDVDMSVEVEGEKIETLGAARGNESTFHTLFGEIQGDVSPQDIISADDYHALRSQLENQLSTWSEPPTSTEAEKAWESFSTITSGLARDLSEQLRLVLEPTQASRLRGDYRTGRRINMRKVIPYIASQFRKDKIWLRRTKPSKREYQIVLAIDDSSSMADNHSKELAFESLALVSRALTLLEAGELAVISFGETPKILHQLGDPFTEQSGARLLQQFSFEQKKTRVGQLVDFATTMLTATRSRAASSAERAQLLVIISDGRIVSEGADRVKQAVRRARESGIFMVFVILDNPESKDSCLDIQHSVFSGGTFVGFSSYLDNFPFPFYLILRDINALPTVLSDALRQWFELVTNMDR